MINTTSSSSASSSSSSSSSPSSSSSSSLLFDDPFIEGIVIKVKSGFYDGKHGYITGSRSGNKIQIQLFCDEVSTYERRTVYLEGKNLEVLFNGIKYVDSVNANSCNDSLLQIKEQAHSWIKQGNIVYVHKGLYTGHIGIVKGPTIDGKWSVHLTSMKNTEGQVVVTKFYGHELTLVSNTNHAAPLDPYFSSTTDEDANHDNGIEEKIGKRKDRPSSVSGFKSLSPHSKSKKKKLSSLVAQDNSSQHTDHSDADPEDESNEARNNLYWVKDKLLPCLWYGNSTTSPDDIVDVLPIKVYDQNENTKLPKTTSLLKVKRKNLIPLEPDILRKQCSNEDTKQFSLALIDFAEYDDYSRDSYLWPEFIVSLLESPRAFHAWIADARSLKVAPQFNDESKLFLYYLSAKLMGEYDDMPQEKEEDSNNENLKHLFDMIYSLVDNTSKDFKRSSSRYGEEYQATLPILDSEQNVEEENQSLAFIADKLSDEILDEYLKVVHALRMRHVACGHIIEAPPAIFGDPPQETSSQYLSYLTAGQTSDIRKTPRKRKGTRFVVATVLTKKPSKYAEPNDLLSSCQNDPAISYNLGSLIDDKKLYDVEVFDGATTWTVPLNSCHILSMPDDRAYEILHKWNYDVKTALQMLEAELVMERVFEKGNWPSKSLENFVKLALPYGFPSRDQLDIRELMESYNEIVDQKNKEIVSTNNIRDGIEPDNTKTFISKNFIRKSFLELTDLIHRYFQGHRAENVAHHLDQLAMKRRAPISLGGSSMTLKKTPFSEKPNNDNEANTNENKITKSTSSHSSKKKKPKGDGPHRWPSVMPLMLHNIYWLKSNNQPCLCLGVDTMKRWQEGIYLRVIAICSSTAHHEISVSISSLEPLTEINIKQCQDEKSVAFTLAMIDFSEWEYDKIKLENPKCSIRWYEYPQFVRALLLHSPSWKAWRAQVERNARGKREDKRTIYLEALKEELNMQELDDRRMDEYPWDDTPISDESEDEPEISKNESSDDNEKKKHSREKKDPEEKKRKIEIILPPPPEPPKKNFSPFNLYWIQRSELPCIYLDLPENRDSEKFKVLPVCCGTYHYPVRVTFGDVEPLTITCLKRCREERTHDFALALMGFAAWDLTQKMQADENGTSDDVYLKAEQRAIHIMHEEMNTQSSEVPFYEWPEFIPNMINNPREWQSWRKRVERGAQQNKDQQRNHLIPKKQLYFAALVEDYKQRLQ